MNVSVNAKSDFSSPRDNLVCVCGIISPVLGRGKMLPARMLYTFPRESLYICAHMSFAALLSTDPCKTVEVVKYLAAINSSLSFFPLLTQKRAAY